MCLEIDVFDHRLLNKYQLYFYYREAFNEKHDMHKCHNLDNSKRIMLGFIKQNGICIKKKCPTISQLTEHLIFLIIANQIVL